MADVYGKKNELWQMVEKNKGKLLRGAGLISHDKLIFTGLR